MPEISMCLSGGAKGADLEWGYAAENAGHTVVHWTFEGHNTKNKYSSILTREQLNVADQYLILANKSIKRSWPTRTQFTNDLLRRNYYQVQWSDSVYAVASFDNSKSLLNVSGGTAWACQMYVDRWLYSNSDVSQCKLFLFEQTSSQWFHWMGEWRHIESPPKPSGVYAGIGTRELTPNGKNAIQQVYLSTY